MLKGKHIILGVSSSIACYKSALLARELTKQGAEVQVLMTKNATEFVTPYLFEQLTRRRCIVDTFNKGYEIRVEHISLADWADVFVTAPADANVIAKFAHGIADDALTTFAATFAGPVLLAPAMNPKMWAHAACADDK